MKRYKKIEDVLVQKWDCTDEAFTNIKELCEKVRGTNVQRNKDILQISTETISTLNTAFAEKGSYVVYDSYKIFVFNETQLLRLYVPLEEYDDDGLELRGYGIMPYNIRPIQCGIQYSHSIVEYALEFFNTKAFQIWGKKYKTAVLLDGGTSNHSVNRYSDEEYIGSMELHFKALKENGIECSSFYEPDLNDMLAGIFLIADERVFNRKKYPDYGYFYHEEKDMLFKSDWWKPDMKPSEEWIESIGGKKNYFLREYLRKLNLWR